MTRPALFLLLALAGCSAVGGGSGAMPPLDFGYLTPIRLNVATVDIEDRSVHDPEAADTLSPVSPAQALGQMAQQRLVPGGNAGRAVFVIDEAAIRRTRGGLDGTLAVHLDVLTTDGARAGYAEARVSRRRLGGSGEESPAVLYDMTRRMMDDMNVEFEFQVRRSLGDWVQTTRPAEPPPGPVEEQPLDAPAPAPAR